MNWFKETWWLVKQLFTTTKNKDKVQYKHMDHYPFSGYSAMSWCGYILTKKKELNIKPTKQNILKYLKSLPDTDSIKKAALQFKNLDDYIKWLNTMPLADNGNINEIENYNFA